MNKFKITSDIIEIETNKSIGRGKAIGARALFEGIVRNSYEGQEVINLEYECYESLAIKEGNLILDEATKQYALNDAFCVHRIGSLEIGETAVIVITASKHRDEAFRACRYIIDEVKIRVPIWKKEHYIDGESGWLKGAG